MTSDDHACTRCKPDRDRDRPPRARFRTRGALTEAVTVFPGGGPEVVRLMLRNIVNGTPGFEELSLPTSVSPKSLHRMLSGHGNPAMSNLAAIFGTITGPEGRGGSADKEGGLIPSAYKQGGYICKNLKRKNTKHNSTKPVV